MKKILFLLLAIPCFVFGQTSDATLTTQAQQIKNETTAGANTANRVGTHLQNLVYSKKSFFTDGTASGTDTYSVSLDNGAVTSLTSQWFVVKFTNANSGASTLNINAIGAKSLVKTDGTALSSGDIDAGSVHLLSYDGTNLQVLSLGGGGGGGSGTVTSVGWTGGIVSIANATTTPAFTIAGTSGGIPYFNSSSTWATSAALAANAIVIGGGAGAAPATTTTGTGVLTALGVNVGSAGAFVTFNGAGGTPSSINIDNTTGKYVIDRTSSSTAGGTITLDMNSQVQRIFTGSAAFSAGKTMAWSNITNEGGGSFHFEVTNVAAELTMPSEVIMNNPNFDGTDWTPPDTGKYIMAWWYDGTERKVEIGGPYN